MPPDVHNDVLSVVPLNGSFRKGVTVILRFDGTDTPLPLKLTECGLPAASLVIVTAPVKLPEVVGLNVTLMVQLIADVSVVPQFPVTAKSPLATMPVILRRVPLVLVSITVCAALVVPEVWLVKDKEVGERLMVLAVEVTVVTLNTPLTPPIVRAAESIVL